MHEEPFSAHPRRGLGGEVLSIFSEIIEPFINTPFPQTNHLSSQILSETPSTTPENISFTASSTASPMTSSEHPISTEAPPSATAGQKLKATASSTTSQPTQSRTPTSTLIDLHSASVSALTSQGPTTTVSSPMTTTPNLDNRPLSFFQKKGAVAGVFSALGCVLIALFLIIILLLRRRHRTKRLQDGDEDMKNLNVRENSLSTVGEAPLTSVAPLAPMFLQGTMSTMWDSDPGSHLMHHIPPPPAYTESSRRPTVSTAHELGTQ
ncbi:hypothetical protein BDZ94DRAFT_1313114 [Collybia nuda]|uniref:Uncharacterized protein n=1 Tax=Collybia nuda TaxID=64659 RepID=A0A9P6CAN1_9AGAR|nr:hypothetical protein BDZ94DRAFT_1313114 [Collybia nuda]